MTERIENRSPEKRKIPIKYNKTDTTFLFPVKIGSLRGRVLDCFRGFVDLESIVFLFYLMFLENVFKLF